MTRGPNLFDRLSEEGLLDLHTQPINEPIWVITEDGRKMLEHILARETTPKASRTRVVNIHVDSYDEYIGRAGKGQDGYFGNDHPVYRMGQPWTECKICGCRHARGEAVQAYAIHFDKRIQRDPVFRARIEKLRGRKLGCFCRPPDGFQGRLMCHGQVIAGYLDGIRPEDVL